MQVNLPIALLTATAASYNRLNVLIREEALAAVNKDLTLIFMLSICAFTFSHSKD
jgi:hypothetical protein